MRVVVITGCSSGIGLEAALAFARRGDTVVATMRELARADALSGRAAAEDLTVHLEQLDVCDDASVADAIGRIIGDHGRLDVLVNNAGVVSKGPMETQPLDVAHAQMETNFWGPMRTMRAALPTMRAQRAGVIVNVSSIASRLPATPYGSMYAATKKALNALSEALEYEAGPFGIRVVSIEPGFFKTEILAKQLVSDEPPCEVYQADQRWIDSFVEASVENGADPAIVADAIVASATDPDTPLHVPVGDDAAMYLDLLREAGSHEGWREVLVAQTEELFGARPVLSR